MTNAKLSFKNSSMQQELQLLNFFTLLFKLISIFEILIRKGIYVGVTLIGIFIWTITFSTIY